MAFGRGIHCFRDYDRWAAGTARREQGERIAALRERYQANCSGMGAPGPLHAVGYPGRLAGLCALQHVTNIRIFQQIPVASGAVRDFYLVRFWSLRRSGVTLATTHKAGFFDPGGRHAALASQTHT
jgi:hypothetical protein